MFGWTLCCSHLEIWTGMPHFYFAWDPVNYVASPCPQMTTDLQVIKCDGLKDVYEFFNIPLFKRWRQVSLSLNIISCTLRFTSNRTCWKWWWLPRIHHRRHCSIHLAPSLKITCWGVSQLTCEEIQAANSMERSMWWGIEASRKQPCEWAILVWINTPIYHTMTFKSGLNKTK